MSSLVQLVAKVLVKRGTDAAGRKISEAIDKRRARNAGTEGEDSADKSKSYAAGKNKKR